MRHGIGLVCAAAFALGCGDRAEAWDTQFSGSSNAALGLAGSVAVRDDGLDRLLLLTSPGGRALEARSLPIGTGIVHWQTDARRERLFVLSEGVQPRRHADDERPMLAVIDGGGWRDTEDGRAFIEPSLLARYELDDPPNPVLYLDPEGQYAVVTVGGGVVQNPNELLLVSLPDDEGGGEVTAKTIRSFGSAPENITFTPRLPFPDGRERRLLIVQTGQEVALIDPEDLETEITVRLAEPLAGLTASKPVEVVVHDNQRTPFGIDEEPRYPIIAIRLANQSTVPFLSFEAAEPSEPSGQDADDAGPIEKKGVDFLVTVNLAEVGSIPADIDFFWSEVNGEPSLRLAAVLPQTARVALVDPETNTTDHVPLGASYSRMTRVTDDVADAPLNSDVALLWGPSVNTVAFWQLGSSGTRSYRSLETHSVGIPVSELVSITRDASAPDGAGYGHLKLLRGTAASEFYVLDLEKRQTMPMVTPDVDGAAVTASPDGERAWVTVPYGSHAGVVRFSDLHPTTLTFERSVSSIHDVAQAEQVDGVPSRAAIALHRSEGSLGATVLDARTPDTADTRFYAGLHLGGLR